MLVPDIILQLTHCLLTISMMDINLILLILCPSFKSYRCIPGSSKGTWGHKHERGYKRLGGDRSLLFCECLWLCFPVFCSGVAPRMILYRCWKGLGLYFLELAEWVCIFTGRTSEICRWEGSLMNFWSSSSCYCQSACEMWQDHGQLCNVEMCCIWNSFLPSTLLCEIRGYDWQSSRGLNHILHLPTEDLLVFC